MTGQVAVAGRGIVVDLGGRRVLNGVDIVGSRGEFVAVIGPNGAGKSTLARVLAGLLPAIGSATVSAGGAAVDVLTLAPAVRARTIAYLPQRATLAWPLTVERLVGLGRLPHLAPFSRIGDADRAAIADAMARADVAYLAQRTATELSGGERARVLLARALAVAAPVLIVDEPLAALDPGHALAMLEVLRAEASRGVAVIAVMHELTLAARATDRLVLLEAGRVAADGPPAAVLDDVTLATVYGVAAWRGVACGAPLIVPLRRTRDTPLPPLPPHATTGR